jgi:hypothetical protein
MDENESKNNQDNGLSPKQMRVIPYMVEYPSMTEAAEKSGVSRNTLYEWMKIPAFRDELEKQRFILYDEMLSTFFMLGDRAIEAYADELGTYRRRAAASDIIRLLAKTKENSANVQRLNEMARRQDEVLKRLANIEAALPQKKQVTYKRKTRLKKQEGSTKKR